MENIKEEKSILDQFYDSRVDFEIVAMTGLEGAGCSSLVNAMCEEREIFIERVKNPFAIKIELAKEPMEYNNSILYFEGKDNSLFLSQLVAKRKYTLCYNYFSKKYVPFTRVQYTKVLWMYSLLYWLQEKKGDILADCFRDKLKELLLDKYRGSKKANPADAEYVKAFGGITENDINEVIRKLDLERLCNELIQIKLGEEDFLKQRGEIAHSISNIFFTEDSAFNFFYKSITDLLINRDYYYLVFFYHRLGAVIRTFGNPSISSDKVKDAKKYNHVFDVVKLINVLVKGLRFKNSKCRIVIDSIRNTIEATFLKERYGAFYSVAVCAEAREGFLKEKVEMYYAKNEKFQIAFQTIKRFADSEADRKEYEDGKLSHPNTSLCVANADIHITNRRIKSEKKQWGTYFESMYEQWMKFAALMLHPGLITPSAEERCMSVAYVSSFNSSCVSRKVGAVITNASHSIRTIGWNDAPYGQVPCGLRSLAEVSGEKQCAFKDVCYSEFERNEKEGRYDNCSFIDRIKNDYNDLSKFEDEEGVPFSYCFRTLDNKYSGEKNQVHTRSLHAEENALIQMVKYGGQSLKDGIIYVTASPCELCSKKLYQVGVRRIVYIEDYPGIAVEQIVHTGVQQPELKRFEGAFGDSFNKLYRPFLSHKDELEIGIEHKHGLKSGAKLMEGILELLGVENKSTYLEDEYQGILERVRGLTNTNKDEQ
jgi:deoxycytidylate deaminase